jgi:hypothetical protein
VIIPADLPKTGSAFTSDDSAVSLSVFLVVVLHLVLLGHRRFAVKIVKTMFHIAITGRFLSPVEP